MMKNVAVFFGGKSCESEISVLTGTFVVNLLDEKRYAVFPVYVGENGSFFTSENFDDVETFKRSDFLAKATQTVFFGRDAYAVNTKKNRLKKLFSVDVALNCCHGGLGEGGGLSGALQLAEIPLASPTLEASGVFMDKAMTKLVLKSLHIPTVDFVRVNEDDYKKRGRFLLKNIGSRLKYPVIIKPAHLGSSIGIAVAENESQAKKAIEDAFALDDRVIIEKFLKDKRDVNCAAYLLDGEIVVSEVEEAASGDGVYTFEEKYLSQTTAERQKSGGRVALKGALREKIRAYTKTVYKRMNLRGIVRMDYLVQNGSVYLSEVNTVPGSLAYYLFCDRLTDARALLGDLIENAYRESKTAEKQVVSTGILHELPKRRK